MSVFRQLQVWKEARERRAKRIAAIHRVQQITEEMDEALIAVVARECMQRKESVRAVFRDGVLEMEPKKK